MFYFITTLRSHNDPLKPLCFSFPCGSSHAMPSSYGGTPPGTRGHCLATRVYTDSLELLEACGKRFPKFKNLAFRQQKQSQEVW